MLEWLQHWYASHCDGDWEHDNGINISTIDNPGWALTIYLWDTKLEDHTIAYTLIERSDDDWIGYSIGEKMFKAIGGRNNLAEMIGVFKRIFEAASDKPFSS